MKKDDTDQPHIKGEQTDKSHEIEPRSGDQDTYRELGSVSLSDTVSPRAAMDWELKSPKAQKIIELIADERDSMAEQILAEDLPVRFTPRDAEDFIEAIENRFLEGKPLKYFSDFFYDTNFEDWGVPVLRSCENLDGESFIGLLDQALATIKGYNWVNDPGDFTRNTFEWNTGDDSDDFAGLSALGWSGGEEGYLRANHISLSSSYYEGYPTSMKAVDDGGIMRNARISIDVGDEFRAMYLVDVEILKDGKVQRLSEPHYISSWDGLWVVKELGEDGEV